MPRSRYHEMMGGCHLVVEGQPLGNDVWRVVGAVLERGTREQPAHEFGIAGLQVRYGA